MKNADRKFKKISALVTLTLFLSQQVVTVPTVHAAPTEKPAAMIEIPSQIGEIEAATLSGKDAPVIIHVQDAHGNYDAQNNIRQILNYLISRGDANLVMLEGGKDSELRPEVLDVIAGRPDLNVRIAERLARKSELSGAEIFLLEKYLTGNPVPAYGMESAPAYKANREAFQKVLRARERSGNFLKDMDMQIERLAAPHMNPALKSFLNQYESYETRVINLITWLQILKDISRKNLDIDFDDAFYQKEWPMLVRFYRLRKLEPLMDRAKIEEEKTAAASDLAKRGVDSGLIKDFMSVLEFPGDETFAPVSPERTLSILEKLMGSKTAAFSFETYPHLKTAIQFRIFQQELKPEDLFAEISRLETAVSGKLARTGTEKQLLALYHDYRMLKKLFALELVRADYMSILGSGEKLSPSSIVDRFASLNKSGQVRGGDFSHLQEINELYALALEFYRGAVERDSLMAGNIVRTMRENSARKAVMVTGGFHSEGMKAYFESKGFSYVLISPKITEIGDTKAYVRSMLDETEIAKSQVANILVLQLVAAILELGGDQYMPRKERLINRAVSDVLAEDDSEGGVARSELRGSREWLYGVGLVTALSLSVYAAFFRPAEKVIVQPEAQRPAPGVVVERNPIEAPKLPPAVIEETRVPAPEVTVPMPVAPAPKLTEPKIDPAEKKRVWGAQEPPKLGPAEFNNLKKLKLTADQLRWLLKNDPRLKQFEQEEMKQGGPGGIWQINQGVRSISETKLNDAEKKEYQASKASIEEFLKTLKEDGVYLGGQSTLDIYYFLFRPIFAVQDQRGNAAARFVRDMQSRYESVKTDLNIDLKNITKRSLSSTYIRTFEDFMTPDEWRVNGGDRLKIAIALAILNVQLDNFKQVVWNNHEWSRVKKLEMGAEIDLYRFYAEKGIGKEAVTRMEGELKYEIAGPRPVRGIFQRPNEPRRAVLYGEEVYGRTWFYSTIHRERFNRPGDFRLGADANPWFPTHTLMQFPIYRMGWVAKRAEDVTGENREPYFLAPVAISLPGEQIRKDKLGFRIPARPDSIWGGTTLGDRSRQRAEDIFAFMLANPSAWKEAAPGEVQYLEQVFDADRMREFARDFRGLWDSGKIKDLYRPDLGNFLVDEFLQKYIDREISYEISNGQMKDGAEFVEKLAKELRERYTKLPYDFQVYLQIPLLRYEAGKSLKLDADYMAYLRADLYQSSIQLLRDFYINNTQAMIGSAYRQGIRGSKAIVDYTQTHIDYRPLVERFLNRPLVLTEAYSDDSGRLSSFVNQPFKRRIDPDLWLLLVNYSLEESVQTEAVAFFNSVTGQNLRAFDFNNPDEMVAAAHYGILFSYSAESLRYQGRMEKIKRFADNPQMKRKAIEFAIRYREVFNRRPDLKGDDLAKAADKVEADMKDPKNSAVLTQYLGIVLGQMREGVLAGSLEGEKDFLRWVETTNSVIEALDPKSRSEVRSAKLRVETLESREVPAALILNPAVNEMVREVTDRTGSTVSLGDVTGDGIPDYLIGAGNAQQAAQIEVRDGNTENVVTRIPAFDGFKGSVEAASFTGADGKVKIAIVAGATGGPRLSVVDYETGKVEKSQLILNAGFRGGLNISSAEVNGKAYLVIGANTTGGPVVTVIDPSLPVNQNTVNRFFAYGANTRFGVRVAIAADPATGQLIAATVPDQGGSAHVKIFDVLTGMKIGEKIVGDISARTGGRVEVADLNGDGKLEVTVSHNGKVTILAIGNLAEVLNEFTPYEGFNGAIDLDGTNGRLAMIPGKSGGPRLLMYEILQTGVAGSNPNFSFRTQPDRVTGSNTELYVTNLRTGQEHLVSTTSNVRNYPSMYAVSPSGKTLVAGYIESGAGNVGQLSRVVFYDLEALFAGASVSEANRRTIPAANIRGIRFSGSQITVAVTERGPNYAQSGETRNKTYSVNEDELLQISGVTGANTGFTFRTQNDRVIGTNTELYVKNTATGVEHLVSTTSNVRNYPSMYAVSPSGKTLVAGYIESGAGNVGQLSRIVFYDLEALFAGANVADAARKTISAANIRGIRFSGNQIIVSAVVNAQNNQTTPASFTVNETEIVPPAVPAGVTGSNPDYSFRTQNDQVIGSNTELYVKNLLTDQEDLVSTTSNVRNYPSIYGVSPSGRTLVVGYVESGAGNVGQLSRVVFYDLNALFAGASVTDAARRTIGQAVAKSIHFSGKTITVTTTVRGPNYAQNGETRTETAAINEDDLFAARSEVRQVVDIEKFNKEGQILKAGNSVLSWNNYPWKNKRIVNDKLTHPDVLILDYSRRAYNASDVEFNGFWHNLFFAGLPYVFRGREAKTDDEKAAIRREAADNGFELDIFWPGSITMRTTFVVPDETQKERLLQIIQQSFKGNMKGFYFDILKKAGYSDKTADALAVEFESNRDFPKIFDNGFEDPIVKKLLDIKVLPAGGSIEITRAGKTIKLERTATGVLMASDGLATQTLDETRVVYDRPVSKTWKAAEIKNIVKAVTADPETYYATVLGRADGTQFSSTQDSTNLMLSYKGKIILVDPSIETLDNLRSLDMMNFVSHIYLTHTHSDHDAGLIDLYLRGITTPVPVIAATVVYEMFVRKLAAISGDAEDAIRERLPRVPVVIDDENAREVVKIEGLDMTITMHRTWFHHVAYGFSAEVTGQGTVTYLTDSQMPKSDHPRYADMVKFYGNEGKGGLVLGETGVPGVHVPVDKYLEIPEFAPSVARGNLYTVHGAGAQAARGAIRAVLREPVKVTTPEAREAEIRSAAAALTSSPTGQGAAEVELFREMMALAYKPGMTFARALAKVSRTVKLEPEELIYTAGDAVEENPFIYAVLEGTAEVQTPDQPHVIVPGLTVGSIAVLFKGVPESSIPSAFEDKVDDAIRDGLALMQTIGGKEYLTWTSKFDPKVHTDLVDIFKLSTNPPRNSNVRAGKNGLVALKIPADEAVKLYGEIAEIAANEAKAGNADSNAAKILKLGAEISSQRFVVLSPVDESSDLSEELLTRGDSEGEAPAARSEARALKVTAEDKDKFDSVAAALDKSIQQSFVLNDKLADIVEFRGSLKAGYGNSISGFFLTVEMAQEGAMPLNEALFTNIIADLKYTAELLTKFLESDDFQAGADLEAAIRTIPGISHISSRILIYLNKDAAERAVLKTGYSSQVAELRDVIRKASDDLQVIYNAVSVRSEVRVAKKDTAAVRIVNEVFGGIVPLAGVTGIGAQTAEEIYDVIYGERANGEVSPWAPLSSERVEQARGIMGISSKTQSASAYVLEPTLAFDEDLLAVMRDVAGNTTPVVVMVESEEQKKIVAALNIELGKQKLNPILTAETVEQAERAVAQFFNDLGGIKAGKPVIKALISSKPRSLAAEILRKQLSDSYEIITARMRQVMMEKILGVESRFAAFIKIRQAVSASA